MVTRWPSRSSSSALAAPTMPAPMTTTCKVMICSGSDAAHAIELRDTGAHIGQRGAERGRLVVHPKRTVRHVLPELHLQIAADLLLRLQVRRVEPALAQRLQLLALGPAEPGVAAAGTDAEMRGQQHVAGAAEEGEEDVPTALVDRLLAGAALH